MTKAEYQERIETIRDLTYRINSNMYFNTAHIYYEKAHYLYMIGNY